MASINLPAIVRASGKRRDITLRAIEPTQAMATDLAAILKPAATIWTENIERILAGYDPPSLSAADAMTLDTVSDVQAAIDATANQFLTRLVTVITPALRAWSVRAERIHRTKWAAAVKAGTGIDLSTILTASAVEETVEAFIARNVALAKNISEQAQGRISDAVFRGYNARTPVREVAKEIRQATGMGRDRAIRIASDQNSKISASLDRERQAEAGITQIKWRHSGKLHPRSWHVARNGKVYDLRSGKPADGGEAIPADDRAGMAPYCGCREQAYIALLDEID